MTGSLDNGSKTKNDKDNDINRRGREERDGLSCRNHLLSSVYYRQLLY